MNDYRHDLLFGTFVTPTAGDLGQVLELATTADRAGLDLVTFQDHPYQAGFLDTSTLLAFVAARTSRIRVAANVTSLPLRPPAVLARAAASLDLLSGGRFELGLGAGAFWEGIAAMGGRRLSPGQGVDALREAIEIIRALWDTEEPRGVRYDGEYYTVSGAKRGPRPAHDISIWVGAYGPKMLRLVGELADGWLPSINFLPNGLDSLPELNERIDGAAHAAGRTPSAVRRMLNFMNVRLGPGVHGALDGPAEAWVEQLTDMALTHGVSAFIIGGDDADIATRFGREIAPAVREAVALERG